MNTIYLTHTDHKALNAILQKRRFTKMWSKTEAFLEEELARANLTDAEDIPAGVVTLNSRVRFTDTDTREELTYWLVAPGNADPAQGKISVLSPVGSALIGYRQGDVFVSETGPRTRRLRVEEVTYQPETHGARD